MFLLLTGIVIGLVLGAKFKDQIDKALTQLLAKIEGKPAKKKV